MFFRPRIYKHKYDRNLIDRYIRRFYNRKTLLEMAVRLGVKLTYIKHRIHALNIAPYKEDKIYIDNKRPYKDYTTFNYAGEFEKAVAYIKFSYSDPSIPFSVWIESGEGERTLFCALRAYDLPVFFCNYTPIQSKQRRKDTFL